MNVNLKSDFEMQHDISITPARRRGDLWPEEASPRDANFWQGAYDREPEADRGGSW